MEEKPKGPSPPKNPRPTSGGFSFLKHRGTEGGGQTAGPTPPKGPRPTSGGFSFMKHKPKTAGNGDEGGSSGGPKPPSMPRPPSSKLAFLSHVPGMHREHGAAKPQAPKGPRPTSGAFSFLRHKPLSEPKGGNTKGGIALAGVEKLQEAKLHNRIVLILFAVAMLWATSLAVARAIVEGYALPRPKMSDVGDKAVQLFDSAESERAGYALCTSALLENCINDYDAAHQAQLDQVNVSQIANEAQINDFETVRVDAKQVLNDTLTVLTDLINNHGLVLNTYYLDPGVNTCPRVENWIDGQNAASRAKNQLDQFNQNTTSKVNLLSDLMSERAAYDAEYFANKTESVREFGQQLAQSAIDQTVAIYDSMNATLQAFRACMSVGGSCPSGFGASFGDIQVANFNGMLLQADLFYLTINQSIIDADAFYEDALEIKGHLTSIINQLNTAGFTGIAASIPDFTVETPPGSFDGIGSFFSNLGGGFPGAVPQPVEIDLDMQQFFDDALAGLASARDSALINANQFAADVQNYYDNFVFDPSLDPPYDPPSLFSGDVEGEYEDSKTNTDQVVDENLEDFTKPDETTEDELERRESLFFFLANNTDDLIARLPDRGLDFYAYDSAIFEAIVSNLLSAGDLLIYADICWRILHTMIIINKYWTLSSIGKPPGDVRFGSSAGQKFGQKMTPDQRVARILTHPFTLAIVVMTFLGLMTSAFWFSYSPFFDEYVAGCVQNTPATIDAGDDDGTMIYRNAFAAAFQFAAGEGDSIATQRVDELNLLRDLDCRVNFEDSAQVFDNHVADYTDLVIDFLESRTFNQEIVDCLNVGQIDIDFAAQNPEIVAKTSNVVFNDPLNPLDDKAVYDCSATNTCEARCADPSRGVLQAQAHESACTLEWWIHGAILGWIMIIVTFILINWFRLEFVAAVVRIWWRQLSPGKYSFLGSMTKDGEKIYPEVMEEKEDLTFDQCIKDAVKEALKSWERWGYIHAVYALLLNAPWIAALIYLSPNLVYPLSNL